MLVEPPFVFVGQHVVFLEPPVVLVGQHVVFVKLNVVFGRATCCVCRATCCIGVRCQVSGVIFLFLQSVEASRWRVCYQQGLPRLVFTEYSQSCKNK